MTFALTLPNHSGNREKARGLTAILSSGEEPQTTQKGAKNNPSKIEALVFAIRSSFASSCVFCGQSLLDSFLRVGNRPGGRIAGRLVEPQKGEQVEQFLRLQLLLDPLRHQRQLAGL